MAASARGADSLGIYRAKRDFAKTPEPRGSLARSNKRLAFVIQKHEATRLHYDFRLEHDGVLLSWAVPKGPSLDPRDKRMAVRTEDHPLSYGSFEGTIPDGQYGAGRVIVWDSGTWSPVGDPRKTLAAGKLTFTLHGQKLSGKWELIRMRNAAERREAWLLFKVGDAHARRREDFDVLVEQPDSVIKPSKPSKRRDVVVTSEPAAPPEYPLSLAWPTGAVKASLPRALAPQLATPASGVPEVGQWRYEVKFDGYRLLARIAGGRARLITRGGHDWTAKLPAVRRATEALKLGSGWLDGEIVVLDADGSPNFSALQKALDDARTQAVKYFVFDLPFFAGHDLRRVPLQDRRRLLETLLRQHATGPLRFSADLVADPARVLEAACRMRLEGLIAKRVDAPYVSRRSASWLKLKCRQRQEFVVAGFTDRGGERAASEVGALLLGVHDESGRLASVGSVGTGWSSTAAVELKKRLSKLEVAQSPYSDRSDGRRGRSGSTRNVRWVKPELVAEIRFSGWTAAGQLRHASFVALRADKAAADVTRETDPTAALASQPPRGAPTGRRVNVSHPDRIIDPASGLTKLDLVRYYESVAEWILPHLRGRPCSLVRAPAGIEGKLFYQKHADGVSIPDVKILDASLWPDHGALLEVATARALIGAAQMNAIELHTWNSTSRNIRRPDRVVFDLDPGDGVPWARVQEGAELVRALLRELSLEAWLKTSGGKGLHVVVPIAPRHDYAVVKQFSKDVVEHIARVIGERFVAKSGPANRVGRIFVDYLRNGEGATTVAAFSARARPGLGVSMPVGWEELPALRGGAHWTIMTARDHLSLRTADPWANFATSRQSLAAALRQLARRLGAAPPTRHRPER